MTTYAAHDDQAIWGVGPTPAAAIQNAEWNTNLPEAELGELIDRLSLAPMSDELFEAVQREGGNVAFAGIGRYEDGLEMLGTAEEAWDVAA